MGKPPTLLAFVVVVLLSVPNAAPQSPTTPVPQTKKSWNTVLGVTLGQSNLAQVQARLGPAQAWHDGDASLSETKVCYLTREQRDALVVVFASNGEMAGPPENDLTNIRILKSDRYPDSSKCRRLSVAAQDVGTADGLKLGMNRLDAAKILGVAEMGDGSNWDLGWSVEQLVSPSDKNYQTWLPRKQECFEGREPFYNINLGAHAAFEGNTVVALSFYRTESVC